MSKYQSEIINEILEQRGHELSTLHYQSECIEKWIEESKGAYPKLCDYQSEWLNYIVENPIGEFPYETITDVTNATINNVVPYAYKSAILTGSTKYHDIDTGEVLDAFEDGRNLELVSVKMPVLTTTGKNLFDGELELGNISGTNGTNQTTDKMVRTTYIKVSPNVNFTVSIDGDYLIEKISEVDKNKSFVRNAPINTQTKTITLTDQTHFLRCVIRKTDSSTITVDEVKNSNLQLEISDRKTTYEPYKSNILTTPSDLELRGIGDVKDTLDLTTGELVQNFGYLYFDGSENWNIYNRVGTMAIGKLNLPNLEHNFDALTSLSDKVPVAGQAWIGTKGISLLNRDVYLTVEQSIANTNDDFKNWISIIGGINLIYRLSQSTVKTVDLSVINQDGESLTKIKPIEGTMHISTSSDTIQPTFSGEIPVEAITQNLSSFIEE